MNTTLDPMIRQELYRYLVGEITLAEFEDWFVPTVWQHYGHADQPASELVGTIELALAEYTSSHATQEDLRHDLQRALNTIMVGKPPVQSASSAAITQDSLAHSSFAGGSADMMLVSVAVSSK